MIANNLTAFEQLCTYYRRKPSVCTDSRKVQPDSLFFALKGNKFNGNYFAKEALENGAAYAVIDEPGVIEMGKQNRYIIVENSLKALQGLAQWHRQQLTIPILAITGSNGKTTTKELLATLLRSKYVCHATTGNFNNHIGVPLTLLEINRTTEVAIIEMGANQIGEIAGLCEIAQPTHGVITSIGQAHLEGFGNLAGVIKGKGELYSYLKRGHGTIFINAAHTELMEKIKDYPNVITYPQKIGTRTMHLVSANPYLIYQNQSNKAIQTHLVGAHHFNNVAAASYIAHYLGIEQGEIDQAIQSYIPSNNRSQIIQRGSTTILLDAYNANPISMRAALETLSTFPHEQKAVILGHMNELGEGSIGLHEEIVQLTAQKGYQTVLLYGPHMGIAAAYNPKSIHFKTKGELIDYLSKNSFRASALLIKGANKDNLGGLIEHIQTA